MTGHSLGGALATLCGARLAVALGQCVPVRVINFGSPRVGDARFKRHVEALPNLSVVRVVNHVFAVVGEAAESRGGEILKFIGDAMLVIFPVSDSRTDVARAMVETARESLAGVEALDCDIHIGFGGHIGEVVQSNIGTPNRLDFTVMGSAVNLASRLESLCKTLNADAVFSDTVALEGRGLGPAGPQSVKGVAEPVETFTL